MAAAASEADLNRFIRAWGDKDSGMGAYKSHCEWREGEGSPENLASAASSVPTLFFMHCRDKLTPPLPPEGSWTEINVTSNDNDTATEDGNAAMPPPLICNAATYDPEVENETYALALAHSIDEAIASVPDSRHAKLTILVDTRGGDGWANPNAKSLYGVGKAVIRLLKVHYVDRIKHLVIYPAPFLARGLWYILKPFLDKKTRSAVCLIGAGATDSFATCPSELINYVTFEQIPEPLESRYHSLRHSST